MNNRSIYAFIIGFCDGVFAFYPSLAFVFYDINDMYGYFLSVVILVACYIYIRSDFPIPITNEWVKNND